MRKLFFTFCFISAFLCSSYVNSAVRSVTGDPTALEFEKKKEKKPNIKPNIPEFKSKQEYVDFLRERIQKAVITEIPPEEASSAGSSNIQPSDDYIQSMKEDNKPFFQQVYENAMARVTSQTENKHKDMFDRRKQIEDTSKQQEDWAKPDYPTVNATLPDGTKLLVPAVEHIPYFMSEIEMMPTGVVKLNEKIVVVANGEKLKNGLSKSLSRYSFSRDGKKNNLVVNLSSVKINGEEYEYKVEEMGNLIIFSPKSQYILEPGVYTYDFEYIVDRQVIDYDTFREFYWNLTGSNWNLIVARAGAMLKMPGNYDDLGRSTFINSRNGIDNNGAKFIRANGSNVIGFISSRPIFVGESMDIIVSMPNENFLPIDVNTKINRAIDDYGDIILSFLGLVAIAGAYFVSWIFISDNKSNSKYSIQRNGPILRYLTKGNFDKISFGAFILELYKKNIVDLKEDIIIKLTDKLDNLSKNEKRAVNNLFPNNESIIKIDRSNALKLNRAYNAVEIDTKERIKKFLLKINAGYITFSIAMLLLSQTGIALLGYSSIYNMAVMVCSDIAIAASLWFFIRKFNSKSSKYICKAFAILLILAAFAVLVSILNTFSALLIIVTIYTIFAYTNMFSNRNGLIKNNIKEAKATREHIIRNVESISFPRNFVSQQPNIFALELTKQFRDKMKDKDFYKLDIVGSMISKI